MTRSGDPPRRRRLAARWLAPVGGLLILVSSACGPAPHAPDIVLITVDTLRADHLGCYGYDPYPEPVTPAIDRLADEAVLFEQCYAPRGQTLPSLTSLLTGLYPSSHDVRDNGLPLAGEIKTLAGELREAGYDTAAFLAAFPGPVTRSVARAFHQRRNPGAERGARLHQDDNDEQVTRLAIQAVQSWGPAGERSRPFFLWVHLFDVHKPYAPRDGFTDRFVPDALGRWRDALEAWDREMLPAIVEATRRGSRLEAATQRRVIGLYDGGVASADERVGRLLSTLRTNQCFEDSLIVLTADHGEELGEHHGYYYHGASVHHGVLHVPLLVKPPGGRPPARVSSLVQNFDAHATILECAGLRSTATESRSLWPLINGQGQGEIRQQVFAEWQDLIETVRTRYCKYIFNPRGAHPRKQPYDRWSGVGYPVACEELYDIRRDPKEATDRAPQEAAVVAVLRETLAAFRARPLRRAIMTRGTARELPAGLGYVGAPADRRDVILQAEDCGPGQGR